MEATPFLRLEPPLDLCTFVCAVVVHDQVNFLIVRELPLQMIEEANELSAPVTLLAGADDFAVENIESGKQRRRTVTLVIVGLPFR